MASLISTSLAVAKLLEAPHYALPAAVLTCSWIALYVRDALKGTRLSARTLLDVLRPDRQTLDNLARFAVTGAVPITSMSGAIGALWLWLAHGPMQWIRWGLAISAVAGAIFLVAQGVSLALARRRGANFIRALPDLERACLELDRAPSLNLRAIEQFVRSIRHAILTAHNLEEDMGLSLVAYTPTSKQELTPILHAWHPKYATQPITESVRRAFRQDNHKLFSQLFAIKGGDGRALATIVGSSQAFVVLERVTNHTSIARVATQNNRDRCPVWTAPIIDRSLETSFDRYSYLKTSVAEVRHLAAAVPEFQRIWCLMAYSLKRSYFTEWDRVLMEVGAFYLERRLSQLQYQPVEPLTLNPLLLELMADTIHLMGRKDGVELFQVTGTAGGTYRNEYRRRSAEIKPAHEFQMRGVASKLENAKALAYRICTPKGGDIGVAVTCGGDPQGSEVPRLMTEATHLNCNIAADSILFRKQLQALDQCAYPAIGRYAFLKVEWATFLDRHARQRLLSWFVAYEGEWQLVLELPARDLETHGDALRKQEELGATTDGRHVELELCLGGVSQSGQIAQAASLKFKWVKVQQELACSLVPGGHVHGVPAASDLKTIAMGQDPSAGNSHDGFNYVEYGDPKMQSYAPPRSPQNESTGVQP